VNGKCPEEISGDRWSRSLNLSADSRRWSPNAHLRRRQRGSVVCVRRHGLVPSVATLQLSDAG
jgi:hypothetical protein